jgi:hypothetical protein
MDRVAAKFNPYACLLDRDTARAEETPRTVNGLHKDRDGRVDIGARAVGGESRNAE